MAALKQIEWMVHELGLAANGRWWRWFTLWFGFGPSVTVSYRLDRALFLLFGRSYGLVRVFFLPVFVLLGCLGARHEIDYRADIGRGLRVLHPTLGVVVSGYTKAGERLTLTGGNCLGVRRPSDQGAILVGSRVSIGANAVILGPISIGDRCVVAAGAVVLNDAPAGSVLAGVPARVIRQKPSVGDGLVSIRPDTLNPDGSA